DLPLADRATISNMAPEYGATCGFFPVDEETLNYLYLTGRSQEQIDLVEKYSKENNLWYDPEEGDPEYSDVVIIDLSKLEPNLSGTKRPQDLIALSDMQKEFKKAITAKEGNRVFDKDKSEFDKEVLVTHKNGKTSVMRTGSLAIAAITS